MCWTAGWQRLRTRRECAPARRPRRRRPAAAGPPPAATCPCARRRGCPPSSPSPGVDPQTRRGVLRQGHHAPPLSRAAVGGSPHPARRGVPVHPPAVPRRRSQVGHPVAACPRPRGALTPRVRVTRTARAAPPQAVRARDELAPARGLPVRRGLSALRDRAVLDRSDRAPVRETPRHTARRTHSAEAPAEALRGANAAGACT